MALRLRRLLGPILASAILLGLSSVQPAAAIERDGLINALRASVQVIVPDNDFENFSLGSGTVLSPGGLVLTNYHVVSGDSPDGGLMNDAGLVGIAVTPPDLRGEAVLKFFGLVVKADPVLDLALVQIVSLADDPEGPLPANLGLSSIRIGDSESLMIGDELAVIGFPGVGENTATYTRGIVSGFLDQDRNGVYEWIKTDAEINKGNSGGLATDSTGAFVGVPTIISVDPSMTGKIGMVRAGNVAIGFVESYFPPAEATGPRVTRVQFSEAINRRGEPIGPAVRFDSGITDLYAVFDFADFEDGQDFEYIWYVDGEEGYRDSFPWDGGANGASWVNVYSDDGLPDGFIEVELLLDGRSIYRGGAVIGEASVPARQPAFGPITFAEGFTNEAPVRPGDTFSDLGEVYAVFDVTDMANGTEWTTRWYLDDQLILEQPSVWNAGEVTTYFVSLSHPDGLPAGEYRLELYVGDDLNQSGSFTVLASQTAAPRTVNVVGTVTDRDNSRRTVAGATIVFLQPGTLIDDWIDADFDASLVYAEGTSNESGYFQLDARVTPGEQYGIVVVHQDYQPVAVDDYEIPSDTADPYDLSVTMQRK